MAAPLGKLPRLVWPLLILLVASLAVLFWLRQRGDPAEFILGGPLFDVSSTEIDGFLVTRLSGQYRFDRDPSGYWSLSGDLADYLSQTRIQQFLEMLARAHGGKLLPGTEIEDARYEFNGEHAIRLTVLTRSGDRHELALGTLNPVTERIYASGAGRPTSFSVSAEFRDVLASLPISLQHQVLLPLSDRQFVQRIELGVGNRRFVLDRRYDRWWIREDGAEVPDLGPLCTAYQAQYDDRRLEDAEGIWYEASWVQVDGLIYETSEIAVTRFLAPAEAGPVRRAWGFDDPYWRVALLGTQIDPDPRADDRDRLEIALVPAEGNDEVPVARRSSLLMTSGEAIRILAQCPDVLANVTGLPLRIAVADSFRLDGPLGPVIWARPTADQWRSYPPPGHVFREVARRSGMEAEDLVRNLDRTRILAVLPPTTDRRVLSDLQRLRLQIWLTDPATGAQHQEVLEFGYLQPDRLPPGSELVDYTEDDLPPVGLWSPATGRLLQIPGYIVTTGHVFRDNYKDAD